MPLCASVPATVDTDLNQHGAYLTDLDKCMKRFNEALTATMNAYRNLLSAFDQVGQVYGNVAQTCSNEVNGPVKEFRDGMRELKDTGGFETFNREIHDGTMAALDPLKQNLKSAMKSFKEVRACQKDYDTVRYNLDKVEKSYAKKEKPLSESKSYQNNLAKREKKKEAFEARREAFIQEIEALQNSTDALVMRSLNNYLHCTATFCGQLEAIMTGYRTDTAHGGARNTSMDRLKEKAQIESSTRQAKRSSAMNSQRHSQGNSQGRATASNASDPAADDDDFYPKKEKHSVDNSYPTEEAHPNKVNESEYPSDEQPPQHQQLRGSESHPAEESPHHKGSSDAYPTEEQQPHKEGNSYPTEGGSKDGEDNGNRYPEEQPGPHMGAHNPFSLNAQ
jgi:hypothetical protein